MGVSLGARRRLLSLGVLGRCCCLVDSAMVVESSEMLRVQHIDMVAAEVLWIG